jgi:hypothetical protein
MLHQNDIFQFLERVNADRVLHYHPNQLLPQLQTIRDHNPNQIRIEEMVIPVMGVSSTPY